MEQNAIDNATKRKIKRKLRILIAVLALCVAAGITLVAILLHDRYTTRQGQEFFASLPTPIIQRPISPPQHGVGVADRDGITTSDLLHTETPLDYIEYIEPVPSPVVVDFDALRETIPNIVGWILSEGTVINYPIVQGVDNDFYLNHLPNGARNAMGSIFLDYRNAYDFSSQTMLIYGHNMASGDKFASLRHYTGQQFFENHSSMFIFTPEQNFELMLIAGYNIDSSVEHPPMGFANEGEFTRFIADLRQRSFFRSNVQVEYGDQLVFLATCIYSGDSPWRRIIVGKLVELDW